MADTQEPQHAVDEPAGAAPGPDALVAELDALQRRVESIRSELDRMHPVDREGPTTSSRRATPATSRRQLLHLAGASAIGAVGGAIATSQPARAADGDPVLMGESNAVDSPTTLDGAFPGPVLSIFNRDGDATSAGLYAYSETAAPTLRVDNDGGNDAVAVAGNAPAGRDLLARGSGRIAMEDHAFGAQHEYFPGELHQSGGTIYAMVTEAVRQVVAAPAAAGALFPIDPIRVYDSRLPVPAFGPITAGQVRTVDINDARDRATGEVVQSGVVPEDATAIVFNLTVAKTSGRGYLSVTPELDTDPATSTVNWSTDDAVVANSSMVGLGVSSSISVYCGNGSTHFIVDVVGYYR